MADIKSYQGDRDLDESITISSGQTLSSSFDCYGSKITAMVFPSTLTGSVINFKGSLDGTTFYDIYNTDGNLFQVDVSVITGLPGEALAFGPYDFGAWRYIKIESDTSEAADREFLLVLEV